MAGKVLMALERIVARVNGVNEASVAETTDDGVVFGAGVAIGASVAVGVGVDVAVGCGVGVSVDVAETVLLGTFKLLGELSGCMAEL